MKKPLRQIGLFPQATRVKIVLQEDHELVRLEKAIDWEDLVEKVTLIRKKKKDQGVFWPSTSLPRITRHCRTDGNKEFNLSRRRGFSRVLRTCSLFVRINGFRLESRSHHDFRIHSDARRRRNELHQHRDFKSSGGRGLCRPNKIDERYDSSGSENPLSKRSWVDGEIHANRVKCGEKGREIFFQSQNKNQRSGNEGQGFGQKQPPLCEDKRAKAKSWKKTLPRDTGHRAILGFNLRKLLREQLKLQMSAV